MNYTKIDRVKSKIFQALDYAMEESYKEGYEDAWKKAKGLLKLNEAITIENTKEKEDENASNESCEFCEYNECAEWEEPCASCSNAYINKFQPKKKEIHIKVTCPHCGATISNDKDILYCPYCGKDVVI